MLESVVLLMCAWLSDGAGRKNGRLIVQPARMDLALWGTGLSSLGVLVIGMLDPADTAGSGNDADNHREDGDEYGGGNGDDDSCSLLFRSGLGSCPIMRFLSGFFNPCFQVFRVLFSGFPGSVCQRLKVQLAMMASTISGYFHWPEERLMMPKISPSPPKALLSHQQQVMPLALAAQR